MKDMIELTAIMFVIMMATAVTAKYGVLLYNMLK